MARNRRKKQDRDWQPGLPFNGKKQRRPGAGRKKSPNSGVSHLTREAFQSRHPQHVVCRLLKGFPNLRRKRVHAVLQDAFCAGKERFGFRLVHYSVQGNHLHLITEAKSKEALARGMKGLCVRIARALNRHWSRTGTIFADRYFARVLRTPTEVRRALVYVLQNYLHHTSQRWPKYPLDPFSSAPWFTDGWNEDFTFGGVPSEPPVAACKTWLLGKGWKRLGLIRTDEAPAGSR